MASLTTIHHYKAGAASGKQKKELNRTKELNRIQVNNSINQVTSLTTDRMEKLLNKPDQIVVKIRTRLENEYHCRQEYLLGMNPQILHF